MLIALKYKVFYVIIMPQSIVTMNVTLQAMVKFRVLNLEIVYR
jgi:hypothetical protein